MGLAVVSVAAGGLPVVDVTATHKRGLPVTEAANGRGIKITKITGGTLCLPVVFVLPPLMRVQRDEETVNRGRKGKMAASME
jgi:hypothetical protein